MFRTKHTFSRLAGGIAVAASLAALSAPSGFGRTNPYGGHDPWFKYAVSLSHQAPVPLITDTLAPGGGSSQIQGYRFITDTLAPGGGIVVSAPAAGGFDWGDAGIGAAGTFGLMLGLFGSARMLQQHRGRVVAT
jgi:hypothetical protein